MTDPAAASTAKAWISRVAFAVVATVALAASPTAYFLTACGPDQGFSERLGWAAFLLVAGSFVYWGQAALGACAVVAVLLAASRTERSIRLRNRIVPAVVVTIAVAALAIGAFVPTRCTIF